MKKKTYFATTLTVFSVVLSVHFLRVLLDWPANIGGWDVPMWISWIAFILASFLAYHAFQLSRKG
ncbi:MAG: hypothetical protein WDZ64_01190 [Parcubacteria group bacterium]